MFNQKIRLRIGELAKLQNMSNQTLHHYDRIGLLPSHQEENGYRYYDESDIYRLDAISTLKESGLGLREIGELLGCADVERVIDRLGDQSDLLQKEIERLGAVKNQIDLRLSRIGDYRKGAGIKIVEGLRYHIVSTMVTNDSFLEVEQSLKDLFFRVKKISHHSFMEPIALVSTDSLYKKEFSIDRMGFQLPSAPQDADAYTLWETELAVRAYHKGTYDTTEATYNKIFSYLEDEGMKVCGDSLEISVIDIPFILEEKEFVTMILIPIEKIE